VYRLHGTEPPQGGTGPFQISNSLTLAHPVIPIVELAGGRMIPLAAQRLP
jgi:hypothetical protein